MVKIKVLVLKADENDFKLVEVNNELSELKDIVGGYLEMVRLGSPEGRSVLLIVNEEGKMMGLPTNFNIARENSKKEWSVLMDVVVGDVFFTVADGEDFGSLTDGEVEYILNLFVQRRILNAGALKV